MVESGVRCEGLSPGSRPPRRAVHDADLGCALALLGDPGYPGRLYSRMGEEAPKAVWIAGDPARIDAPLVAFVGSRHAAPGLLASAGRLAHRLADAGWVIASGCARGADAAALEGGLKGAAGALGIPACGLSRLPAALAPASGCGLTLLAVAPPKHPFNAGYALRRNRVVGSLADALVLIAAGRKSGSWYAVRRALDEGTPIFSLESGPCTPSGNAWLLCQGLAAPIKAGGPPESGVAAIAAAVRARETIRPRMSAVQPDFLDGLAGRAA